MAFLNFESEGLEFESLRARQYSDARLVRLPNHHAGDRACRAMLPALRVALPIFATPKARL